MAYHALFLLYDFISSAAVHSRKYMGFSRMRDLKEHPNLYTSVSFKKSYFFDSYIYLEYVIAI